MGEYEYFLEPHIDTFRIGKVWPVLGELDHPDLDARGLEMHPNEMHELYDRCHKVSPTQNSY